MLKEVIEIAKMINKDAIVEPLFAYKVTCNGNRLAVIDYDKGLVRLDNKQWMSVEALKETIFVRRLSFFVRKHYDADMFMQDDCYAFKDDDTTWLIEYADGKAKFANDDEWEDVSVFFENWERTLQDGI